MNKSKIHNCRVCGFYMMDPPWGEDNQSPTYEMCFCCGVEFGNQDYTVESTFEYRRKWLKNGAEWDDSDKKPHDWNLEKQMWNLPEAYQEASQ